MITEPEFKKLAEKVFKAAKAKEVEILLDTTASSLTRYADNIIHQNVTQSTGGYTIKVQDGKKVGKASGNKLDEASLVNVLRTAEEFAKAQKNDPTMLPMVKGPQKYSTPQTFVQATQQLTPEERAAGVCKAIAACKKNKVKGAGIFENSCSSLGLANNQGVFAFQKMTGSSFGLTAATADSSGWAEEDNKDVRKLNIDAICETAISKALQSRHPVKIAPGKYTVIMEHAAAAEMLMFVSWLGFGTVAYQEGRSPFSGKMGKKIFGDNVTLVDDFTDPLSAGLVFDFEGLPRQSLPLIENGVLKNMVYDRKTAKKDKKKSTGHGLPTPNSHGAFPGNILMTPGDSSLEKMIASTERGLLVTHFHYTNVINPKLMTLTGLTRDGVFLVEKGKIVKPVNNFRFTVSAMDIFNNIEQISRDRKSFGGRFVLPALKVRDFDFTSGTDF